MLFLCRKGKFGNFRNVEKGAVIFTFLKHKDFNVRYYKENIHCQDCGCNNFAIGEFAQDSSPNHDKIRKKYSFRQSRAWENGSRFPK